MKKYILPILFLFTLSLPVMADSHYAFVEDIYPLPAPPWGVGGAGLGGGPRGVPGDPRGASRPMGLPQSRWASRPGPQGPLGLWDTPRPLVGPP